VLKPSRVALAAVIGLAAFSLPALADDASAPDITSVPMNSDVSAPTTDSSTGGVSVSATLQIPTITTVDSSMSEAAIRDALSGNFAAHVKELQSLTATSIKIPEIDITVVTTGDAPSTTNATYKDIELDNVKNGVAGGFSIGSSSSSQGSEGTATFGKIAASYLDVGALLGFYFGGVSGTEMVPVQKNVTLEGGTFTGPNSKCTIGKETLDEFDARPLKMALGQVIAATQGLKDAEGKMSPEGAKIIVPFFIDLFESLKSTPITLGGFNCSGTSADTNAPFQFSTGTISIDGFAPGIIPGMSLNNLKVSGSGVDVTLDNAAIKPTDLSAPFAALTAAGDLLSDDWFSANARKLIPAWGGFSLKGLDVTGPDPTSPGNQVNVKVGSFDLSLDKYVNGIPSAISTSATAVVAPVPNDPTDDGLQLLRQAGITTANLNFDFSASWDKPTRTIAIDKLALSDPELFISSMSMVLGNASDTLFDANNDTATAAAQALTFNSMHLTFTDRGAGDKIVPLLAQQQNTDAQTFRTAAAGQAAGAVLALLGATDDANTLSQAVSAFVLGKAKTLDVTIKAKDSSGVPLATLEDPQNQSDPTTLLALLSVTGSSE